VRSRIWGALGTHGNSRSARKIDETLALYEQLLAEQGDDMMASDVRGEIRGSGEAGEGLE
jgi:hypothetical protein